MLLCTCLCCALLVLVSALFLKSTGDCLCQVSPHGIKPVAADAALAYIGVDPNSQFLDMYEPQTEPVQTSKKRGARTNRLDQILFPVEVCCLARTPAFALATRGISCFCCQILTRVAADGCVLCRRQTHSCSGSNHESAYREEQFEQMMTTRMPAGVLKIESRSLLLLSCV